MYFRPDLLILRRQIYYIFPILMALHSVLFDLDGVLLDTEGIYSEFWAEMDRLFPTGVENFAHVIKGSTLSHILATYFPDPDVQIRLRELLRQQELTMSYPLFDGVIEMLTALKAAGVKTAIVTSSNSRKMQHIFKMLPDFAALIDTLVVDEDVSVSKPDPEGYLLAAHRLGAPAGQFAVVEDSLAGLRAGRSAGARVIGITTTNPRDLVEPLADKTFDAFNQISIDDLIS